MRTASGKVLLAVALCTSCQGAPNRAPISPVVARVEIAPVSLLLTTVGQTRVLVARTFDGQGSEVKAAVTWSSSSPDDVAVDPSGRLAANRIGSSQIFAEAGGVRSPPALVVVAQPAPGAVLVTDAQVVAVDLPVLAAGEVPGVGTNYDVRLRGVSPAPASGTVVLASETAPVAGRVVSTRDESGVLVVTLAVAPLYEVFSSYHLNLVIDLAPYGVIAESVAPTLRTGPLSGGTEALSITPSLVEPFKAFDCTGSVAASLFTKTVNLGIENNLQLILKSDKDPGSPPGYLKVALGGSLALTGTVEIGINATVSATGTCIANATVDLPVFGWLSVLVMPGVRLGAGVELQGKLTVAKATLGVTGKVGVSPEVGWECGPSPLPCHGLTKVEPLNELKPKVEVPSIYGMNVEVSGQFFALIGLDLVFLKGLGGHFAIAEARFGPKQSGKSLALEDDQAHEAAARSSYDLVLLGTLKPGSGLQAAIKAMINDDAVGVTLQSEVTVPLSESPRGAFTVDRAQAGLGQKVKLTVDLDPKTVDYLGLDYNVDSIRFRRKTETGNTYDEIAKLTIPVAASGQTHFEVDWTPEQADAGKNDIAAFVRTTLPILPDLEIAEDSRKQVEVLAFCPAVALLGSPPGSLLMAAAAGCGGTLRHVNTITFPGAVGGGTRTRTATAQVQLVKDEEASAPTIWALRPVGTWAFEESGNIGACTLTIASTAGTWTPQPPLGSGPGAVLLYTDTVPFRYEGNIGLSDSTGDYLYFNEVWACPAPEGTHTEVVYFGPSASFELFRVAVDQSFDAGLDGKSLVGSYDAIDPGDGSSDSFQWDLHLN